MGVCILLVVVVACTYVGMLVVVVAVAGRVLALCGLSCHDPVVGVRALCPLRVLHVLPISYFQVLLVSYPPRHLLHVVLPVDVPNGDWSSVGRGASCVCGVLL